MHESNDANPYEAPRSPSGTPSRKVYVYVTMLAIVAVFASAAALVITRSTKSIPEKVIYMDRGPSPQPVEMPPGSQSSL